MLKLGRGMLSGDALGRSGSGGSSRSSAGGGSARVMHPFADLFEARLALLAAAAWRPQRAEAAVAAAKQAAAMQGGGSSGGVGGTQQQQQEEEVTVIDDSMDEGGEGGAGGAGARQQGLGWRLLGLCWEQLFDKPVQVCLLLASWGRWVGGGWGWVREWMLGVFLSFVGQGWSVRVDSGGLRSW